MQILAVAPYVPYEGVPHAGGEYLLRHLEHLSRTASVTLLVPGSADPGLVRAQARHAPAWLDLVVCELELAERRLPRRVADAAYRRALGSPPAPSAESLRALRCNGLRERARRADLVELHWPEYARFATELRRAGVVTPVSVVEHDVDLHANARRLRLHARGYRRILGLATSPIPRRRELSGLKDADLVLVFKASDAQLLRDEGVQTAVRVLDPWLDVPVGPDPGRVPGSVVFAGAMWKRENVDGALWFLAHVWPRVRAAVPGATFTLAGAGPPDELSRAAAAGGVQVTGDVPDLLPYYRQAQVFVAPLFLGGGMKFKVPQAMLCGLPVVSTTNAAQGILEQAPPGTFWAVTDDPGLMSQEVVAALLEPHRAAAVGDAAAQWCRARFSFSRSLEAVLTDYVDLTASREADRRP